MTVILLTISLNILCSLATTKTDVPFILYPSNENDLPALILRTYIYQITHQHSEVITALSSSEFITKYETLQSNNRYGFILLSNTNKNKQILTELFEAEIRTTSKLSQEYFNQDMDKYNDSHSIHFINNTNILCLGHNSYCIFSLLQLFGVRFRIHNDIIPRHPNKTINQLFKAPEMFLHNKHWLFTPTFNLRGIQPFHDFAEGPDWWNNDDYKALSEQIYKMKMNFQGYHTYPVREPLVWTGLNDQFNSTTGDVSVSYPSSWMTTLGWVGGPSGGGGDWGGIAVNTSDYVMGASQLYFDDCYSNEIQQTSIYPKLCPYGTDMDTYNDVFNNAGKLLHDVFNYAHLLDIKNCVGTETPLTKPPAPENKCNGPICPLRTYYSSIRKDHFVTSTDCAECENLYEFVRTEGWLNLAQTSVFNTPLSTCYNGDSADNVLVVGSDGSACPQSYSFVRITGYASSINTTMNGTKMIPLMTYDNTEMQDHWVLANGTSAKDAVTTGYTLETPTKIVYVLSSGKQPYIPTNNATTMDYYQGIFNRITATYPIDYYWLWTPENWEWQHVKVSDPIVNATITDIETAYQAMQNVDANFSLAACGWVIGPDGNRSYLNGYLSSDIVMSSIEGDLGRNVPDAAYKIISTDRETWDIPWMEDDPDLTALQLWVNRTMNHMFVAKSYGVTGIMGIHWRTQEISPQISALSMLAWNSTNEYGGRHVGLSPQNSLDFWMDWVKSEFNVTNVTVIQSMATLFNDEIDSNHLPDSFNAELPMQGCPGILKANGKSWTDVAGFYAFVDKFNCYKSSIIGAENMDRFSYWSNMFGYIKMMGKVGVDWGHLDSSNAHILLNDTMSMINYLMAAMSTKGTMGTLTNIQQQLIPKMIRNNKLSLPMEYSGVTRMFVMSARSIILLVDDNTEYNVQVMILSKSAPIVSNIILYYRELTNNTNWKTVSNFVQKGGAKRQVYITTITMDATIRNAKGFEYYIQTKADSISVRWPVANSYVVTVTS